MGIELDGYFALNIFQRESEMFGYCDDAEEHCDVVQDCQNNKCQL